MDRPLQTQRVTDSASVSLIDAWSRQLAAWRRLQQARQPITADLAGHTDRQHDAETAFDAACDDVHQLLTHREPEPPTRR